MNGSSFIDKVVGGFDDKKRWRAYKVRTEQLPANYRMALQGVERYLMYSGAIVKGDVLVNMLEDLADLFEQAAAAGTPIREIVGGDPVAFADDFLRNYADGQWITKERARLVATIEQAEAADPR